MENVKNINKRNNIVVNRIKSKGLECGYDNVKKCSVNKRCGGCSYLSVPYDEQLKNKQKELRRLFEKNVKVNPVEGMDNPYHYRNKVHAVFSGNGRQVISGVYVQGTHKVVPVESCLIEDEKADMIIATIKEMLKSFKIRPYNEDTGEGLLRHVLVRRGFETGEIMVVLVMSSLIFPSKNNFVKALLKEHPEITTIVVNENNKRTSMVLGNREKVIYGKGYIEDTLCGCTFRLSSKSFYQVNPVQTEKLYTKAIDLLELTGCETVIDAYCGIGTMGIIASVKAKNIIGVELNGDAVKDAISNSRRNKVSNAKFYAGDAGDFIADMAVHGGHADAVIMDPPRSGSTQKFIDSIAVLKPEKVVYVSCNPETLSRDLKYFKAKGYETHEVCPFDMFPHTEHIEVVCCLVRNK